MEVVCIPGAFELPPEYLCLFWAEARLRLSSQHAQLVAGGGGGGVVVVGEWGEGGVSCEAKLNQVIKAGLLPMKRLFLRRVCK